MHRAMAVVLWCLAAWAAIVRAEDTFDPQDLDLLLQTPAPIMTVETVEERPSLSPATAEATATLPSPLPPCVGTEQALRKQLNLGTPTIFLCGGPTIVQSVINITGLSFDLKCGPQLLPGGEQSKTCTLSGNNKTSIFAGAPVAASFSRIEFTRGQNTDLAGGGNGGGHGGAIHVSAGQATFHRCNFTSNQARIGGALFIRQADVTMVDCAFHRNVATVTGGAILVISTNTVRISNTRFVSNQAGNGGSAMAVFQSRVNVERCHFWNGLTKYKHGALFVHLAKVNLTSSAFSNNIPIKLNGGSGGSTNHTNATDIFVDDDIPPSSGSGGSFVRCNNEKITGPSPVNFCNGLDGIVESNGGDAFDNNTNTDCHIIGIVDPTSEACGTW